MEPAVPTKPGLSVRDLPPNIFAVVMATGIVSLALQGAGYPFLAQALFWLNVALYAVLSVLLLSRLLRYRANLAADVGSHARAPGFFTLVAAPCVLGNQCVLLFGATVAGLTLWIVGITFWLVLTYAMLPRLMEGAVKPGPKRGSVAPGCSSSSARRRSACWLVCWPPRWLPPRRTCRCLSPWRSGWSAACCTSG
jgi:hypothetical protein